MGTSAGGKCGADSKLPQTLLAWVCVSVEIGVLVATSANAGSAFKGDPELFRELAMAQRGNAERISSWQGSSRVEVTRTDPNGVLLRDTSAYHYIYVREHNATRWNWTPEDRYTRKDGKLMADPLEDKRLNEMRKGDAFYKYDLGVETREGEKRGAMVIWPVQKAEEGAYSYSFDPMWYLTGKTTGWDDMAAGLMGWYRKLNDPNFTRFARYAMTRDGSLVTLDIENPTADMASHYVFDLSKGGTLARYDGTMKESAQSIEWTYEEKDGVWIPKTWTQTIEWDPPKFDGCTKYTRTVTFIENTLNHPVPASEFSLDKLGLKVGDLVSDHKLGLRYEYGGLTGEAALQIENLPEDKSSSRVQSDVQTAASREDDASTPDHSPTEEVSSTDPNSEHPQPTLMNGGRDFMVWPIVLLAAGGMGLVLLRRQWKGRAEP